MRVPVPMLYNMFPFYSASRWQTLSCTSMQFIMGRHHPSLSKHRWSLLQLALIDSQFVVSLLRDLANLYSRF
eukprot:4269871-Amphidinium_carterae.1